MNLIPPPRSQARDHTQDPSWGLIQTTAKAVVKREELGALHNGRGVIHRRGGFAGQLVTVEVLHNARIGGSEPGCAAGGRTIFA